MVDLVQQLRETKDFHPDSLRTMVLWGADEIERLRASNTELVGALEAMVKYFGYRDTAINHAVEIITRARAAIAKAKVGVGNP